ncbi:MAG: 4-hydroxybenzoate octaprenyltransferase [Gammaproteobacteria bacterium]|nr:4-hydroxybenzoate octaprenyltransferase [Gammaproteobacteria bacterium]
MIRSLLTPALKERLRQYYYLTRLHRPIGIFLLLWPTLWALWIASAGKPSWGVLAIFIAGVVLMRSAGCVINDYADRNIDPHVARTRERPMGTGKVAPREALILFVVLCLCAFGLVLLTNRLTVYLSVGALSLAVLYPFAKRYTHLPQVVLGMAFALAVPMAYAAQTGALNKLAWLIYVVTVVWAVIYDTMYAMADREDDLKIGVKSTAILFGEADRVILLVLQVLLFLGLFLVGRQAELGWPYDTAVGVAGLFALYQQFLIRRREPQGCLAAFINNHWLGLSVFVGIVISYSGLIGKT